jgi:hypothetical protein
MRTHRDRRETLPCAKIRPPLRGCPGNHGGSNSRHHALDSVPFALHVLTAQAGAQTLADPDGLSADA